VAAPVRGRPGEPGPSAVDEEITQRQGQAAAGRAGRSGQLAGGEREEQDAPTAAQQHEAELGERRRATSSSPENRKRRKGTTSSVAGNKAISKNRPVEPHAAHVHVRRQEPAQVVFPEEVRSELRQPHAQRDIPTAPPTTLTMAAKPATRASSPRSAPAQARIQPQRRHQEQHRPPAPWSARPARTLRPRAPTNRGVTFRRESQLEKR